MNILHFIVSIDKASGGPSRSVPLLVKGQTLLGHNVTLLTIRSDNMNLELVRDSMVSVKILERDYKRREIRDFIVSGDFDIIQLQSIWDLRYHYVACLARQLNIPYIVTPRGMLEPWSLKQKAFKKKLALALYQKRDFNKAACVHTTADMEAHNIRALNIKSLCAVIPNGIECEKYPCRVDQSVVKKQILFLSRIHVKKGIELLIEAWEKLVREFPDWTVKIVGNGDVDYINHLKQLIEDRHLSDCISIMDPVFGDEKIKLYQESALFVLPSYSENFGMVVAEAMSCGVPVITTEGTPWDMLDKENIGWQIPVDSSALEATLRKACSHSLEKLFEVGQRGSIFVANNFDYKRIASRTCDMYKRILARDLQPETIVHF